MMRTDRVPGTSLLLALLVLALVACSRGGGAMPTASDVPELWREAQGESRGGSRARRAVREAMRVVIQRQAKQRSEVSRLMGRPHLKGYLMLDESFIGGTFPKETAVLLREVQRLEEDYDAESQGFPFLLDQKLASAGVPEEQRKAAVAELTAAVTEREQPVLAALDAHVAFLEETAELYELAAAHSDSIKSMRTGLEISDSWVADQFNAQVDVVNAANDTADAAIRALPPEHSRPLTEMQVARRVEK